MSTRESTIMAVWMVDRTFLKDCVMTQLGGSLDDCHVVRHATNYIATLRYRCGNTHQLGI